MLNGALCLTDSSVYLDEILQDNVNCKIYSVANTEELPDMVGALLSNPVHLQEIIDNGYEMAKAAHTWEHRAVVLHDLIEKQC